MSHRQRPSIEALAREQLAAYDTLHPLLPPSEVDDGFDMHRAYQVLACIRELRRARGERMIGRKIGFTNRNIWAQYGVDSPIWAPVYDSTLAGHCGGALTFPLTRTFSPRIEPEIAFGLRTEVPTGEHDPERILAAIEWVAPAFEIVDCHYPDWRFRVQDAVAQQGLHAALILGPRTQLESPARAHWVDRLRDCRATLQRDAEIVERGVGSNALGHPALAIAFLAEVLAGQAQFAPLAAGEIVTTGTLTAALPIATGETWRYELEGIDLASLQVRFTV